MIKKAIGSKNEFEELLTKTDLTIIGLATREELAKGRLNFVRWMFLLTIAQALIAAIAVHFWMK